MKTYLAQITNPAITKYNSSDGGTNLGQLMAALYRAAVMAGALALFLYIAWGGISWLTAGGDKGKLTEAKDRITHGIVGMAILVATTAIAAFLGQVFGIDILNPSF